MDNINEKETLKVKSEHYLPDIYATYYEELEKEICKNNEIKKEHYNYLVIDSRSQDVPDYDLGIEITIPKLAEGKINIDPQHGPDGSTESSAIEEALTYDLDLIKDNAILATVRPDSDSIGAMAVLELRKSELNIDIPLVKGIGRADAVGIKKTFDKYPEMAVRSKEIIASRIKCLDRSDVKEKVQFMKKLLTNSLDWKEIEDINQKNEKIKQEAKKGLKITEIIKDKLVMVEGNHPLAFDIGYEQAGIVIAYNPYFKRPWIENDTETQKWTIARCSEEEPIDMNALKTELNKLEKEFGGDGNWGGPINLVASPQGITSKVPSEKIIETVNKFIENEELNLNLDSGINMDLQQ